MTHNEPRSHALRESLLSLSTGVLYGSVSVLVGHPFDTIKTKMTSQHGFLESHEGMSAQLARVYRTEGLRGLYRGWWPPLWGSAVFRSVQFAVFEGLFTHWGAVDDPAAPKGTRQAAPNETWWTTEVPGTGGMQRRVLAAAVAASTARSVVECPVEYAKVNRQILQGYALRDVFRGYPFQWVRSSGVMVTYFVVMDNLRRKHAKVFDTYLGAGLASACSATLGFWLCWPAEVIKNQVQGRTPVEVVRGGAKLVANDPTVRERVAYLIREHGFRGLYRGIWPGTVRSMLSNGVAMMAMRFANTKLTEWGLR
ncbi:mitochondrial substrate carrier family protein S-like protein [Hyaloraphidium curvatum]|nr:mitochondrial substrate carrier family protein S-like protein [Hyaloraphidium curvatum]